MDSIIGTVPSDKTLRVPLIDMAKLVDSESQETELQKFHAACKEWGIFQVT
jgi:isopenicillin N synthase-like dioxygenase